MIGLPPSLLGAVHDTNALPLPGVADTPVGAPGAEGCGVTAADGLGASPLEVSLAWVRDRPGVVAPVVGARDTAQLAGSLAAEEVELAPAIRAALDDVSAIELGYPERPLG